MVHFGLARGQCHLHLGGDLELLVGLASCGPLLLRQNWHFVALRIGVGCCLGRKGVSEAVNLFEACFGALAKLRVTTAQKLRRLVHGVVIEGSSLVQVLGHRTHPIGAR